MSIEQLGQLIIASRKKQRDERWQSSGSDHLAGHPTLRKLDMGRVQQPTRTSRSYRPWGLTDPGITLTNLPKSMIEDAPSAARSSSLGLDLGVKSAYLARLATHYMPGRQNESHVVIKSSHQTCGLGSTSESARRRRVAALLPAATHCCPPQQGSAALMLHFNPN